MTALDDMLANDVTASDQNSRGVQASDGGVHYSCKTSDSLCIIPTGSQNTCQPATRVVDGSGAAFALIIHVVVAVSTGSPLMSMMLLSEP